MFWIDKKKSQKVKLALNKNKASNLGNNNRFLTKFSSKERPKREINESDLFKSAPGRFEPSTPA